MASVTPPGLAYEVEHDPAAQRFIARVRGHEALLEYQIRRRCMVITHTEVPEAIVGAGTLRTPADVQAAVEAGCRFGVSPGYTPALGRACRDVGLPLLPGVATASEVMAAGEDGLTFLKFFPATAAGGVPMLKALGGPFPDVVFCPTGGLTPQNAPEFLALPNVKVCGGSWLTPPHLMQAGDWAGITALARAASTL